MTLLMITSPLVLSDLQASALHLGATCRSKLDKSVTHYICQVSHTPSCHTHIIPPPSPLPPQGKATEVLREREAKVARDRGCHLVSPHWLQQCQQRGSRLPEADFPVTFNPSMALVSPTHISTPPPITSSDNLCLLSLGCLHAIISSPSSQI